VGVEVDRPLAMAGDQAELVAETEPVGGRGDGEPSVLVGGALIGGGGLISDERRPESKASAFAVLAQFAFR
jgi:hypothetical protein